MRALGKLRAFARRLRRRRRINRHDEARHDRLSVFVSSDLDGHEPADDFRASFAILRKLERRDDVFGRVALDGDLRVDSADQRGMAARTFAVVAAMVHDDDGALERVADRVCGSDIGRHILVVAFRAGEAPVEGVDHDDDGPRSASRNAA